MLMYFLTHYGKYVVM